MKNFRIVAVLFLTMLMAACQEETLVSTELETENEEVALMEKSQDLARWGKYCFPIIEHGRWIVDPFTGSLYCNSNLFGICSIDWFCFIPPILIDPCGYVPCWPEFIDPWEIYRELKPEDFISFRDKLDIDINPETGLAPFRINEATIGLQFYAPIKEVLNEEVLILENDLNLGKEFAEQYKVIGNTIPAGKYPVVFNPENKTFNAIVTLGK